MSTAKDLPKELRESARRMAVENAAGRAALAEPLPGHLADVFAVAPNERVGKWTVRPMVDMDIEVLRLLEHPLFVIMKNVMAGTEQPGADEDPPRGPEAWELCYLLTRDVDEVERIVGDKGLEAFRDGARREFGRLRMYGLAEVLKAVFRQVNVYWSPVVGHEPAGPGDDGKEVAPEPGGAPFASQAPPSTGTGGSSGSGPSS